MSSHYSSVEIKVGLFLAFSLALFVGMTINFGRFWTALGRERVEINVAFEDVSGLKIDAPVRYNGLEVGRVKWMRVLHLDDTAIERLPALSRRDLHNLPMRPDSVLKTLRASSDADFPSLLKQTLKDRSMIELCLEVLQEGDARRYRVDDQVRVVTTVFGDTAVEIISGNGPINKDKNRLLLGMSGDFFTNLARSMGDVKDILSSVTDVVGTDERKSFERSQERFAPMSEKLDAMAAMANRRSAETAKKLEKIGDDVNATLTRTQEILQKMQPQAKETSERVREGFAKIQERIDDVQTSANKAFEEISADKNAIKKDVDAAIEQSKPNFEQMRSNIRGVYDVLGGLSLRLDGMRNTGGQLLAQSEPEMARTGVSLKRSLLNLRLTGQAANENKDLMISLKDMGEHEFNTAVLIYRDLLMSTRRAREAYAALQDATTDLADAKAEAPLKRADMAMKSLSQMRSPLEKVRDTVEDSMLPLYERKKSAWTDDVPAAK
ncbi:MAG TPA: MlaD family protein [Planctomycetota bacterium]|nr:MlaD family protein [Planctomycetota bacterium]